MDTGMHAAHGALMMAIFTNDPWYILISAIVGALPDLVGWAEKLINKGPNDGGWYEISHAPPGYWPWLSLLKCTPPYCLHIWLDRFTHGEGKRWWVKGERLSWEIWGWVITILLTALLIYVKYV